MDDHERDGMETKRTYHGWQMDEDRSCGMRSIEIDGETQKETRKRRRRMMERARRLGRVWMEATWNGTQCSSCFVSFRFVGGSWWFPKMRRSKPSIDARGRHWIAPCEAKDDVCSHAFPTKNERIDGKKPRRKQIHETRHTHPSTIDHETRHDAIVHRPTPSCFFFFFFLGGRRRRSIPCVPHGLDPFVPSPSHAPSRATISTCSHRHARVSFTVLSFLRSSHPSCFGFGAFRGTLHPIRRIPRRKPLPSFVRRGISAIGSTGILVQLISADDVPLFSEGPWASDFGPTGMVQQGHPLRYLSKF